jgi:hypothetical protein
MNDQANAEALKIAAAYLERKSGSRYSLQDIGRAAKEIIQAMGLRT